MHRNSPKAQILVVTKTKTVSGHVVKIHKLESVQMPWRVSKRSVMAHRIGLEYVRSLGHPKALSLAGDEAGVLAVTVTDGKHALASWRRMDGLNGFTGTHEVHPMVTMSGIKKWVPGS